MGKLSNQKNKNSVIKNWTKKTSIGWLRKHRDDIIENIEEIIKEQKML